MGLVGGFGMLAFSLQAPMLEVPELSAGLRAALQYVGAHGAQTRLCWPLGKLCLGGVIKVSSLR